jgi:glutathione synthase/RimK-type ligase-like ATP-grasp enzyme
MRQILVSSYAGDAHAEAVLWGLAQRGHAAALWQPHLFPARQALSVAFDPAGGCRHAIEAAGEAIDLNGVTTIWYRRSRPPLLAEGIDPRDRDFAERESVQHLDGFLATAFPDALQVNPPAAARLDTDKAVQLCLAAATGFAIPPTLLSNSPDEVAAFFEANGGDIVYKSFRGEHWSEGEGTQNPLAIRTAAVTREDLAGRQALAMCPGIFQARIEKAFELRVTVMGATCFCVRIDAADSEAARLDWRSDKRGMRLSVVPLPGEIEEKCRAFMAQAGLVFGCFDVIVTPAGESVFLEVNQMGQFLWQEERLPELRLLDAICAFLASGDPAFRWTPPRAPLAFADWRASALAERARRAPAPEPIA